jgi:uncharacterized protein
MRPLHWLLPETPDLPSLLQAQLTPTNDAITAFAAWAAAGDAVHAASVRSLEEEADAARRELLKALRSALVTPLEPEDVFALSQGLDALLTEAKDVVGESEVMACPPDAALAEMAGHLDAGLGRLGAAIAAVVDRPVEATAAAEAVLAQQRGLEHAYRRAMAALLADDDLREVIARRELYRRCSRMGQTLSDVAERVIYATFKLG